MKERNSLMEKWRIFLIIITFCAGSIVLRIACKQTIVYLCSVLVLICCEEVLASVLIFRRQLCDFFQQKRMLVFICVILMIVLGCRGANWFDIVFVSQTYKYVDLFIRLLIFTGFLTAIFFTQIIRAPFHFTFLVIALTGGISFMLLLPVGQVPDELYHRECAYRTSNIILGIDDAKEGKGLYMRKNDLDFPEMTVTVTEENRDWFWSQLGKKTSETQLVYSNSEGAFGQNLYYLYFFPGLGITLGRLLHLNAASVYILGRMMNLLLYLLIATYSVKAIPYGKEIIMAVLMFPVSIQQTMSYSYDSIVISLGIFIISETLFLADNMQVMKQRRKVIHMIFLIIGIALLLPVKGHAYFPVAFLLLYLWSYIRHWDQKKVIKCILMIILAAFLLVIAAFAVAHVHPLPENENIIHTGEQGYTIAYILNHPGHIMEVIRKSVNAHWYLYYTMMICGPLGWMNVGIDGCVIPGFSILMVLAIAAASTDAEGKIKTFDRLIWILVFVMTSLCIVFGMWLNWTSLSEDIIQGVQGRYFIPIILLPLLALISSSFKLKKDYAGIIPIAAAFLEFMTVTSVI